VRDRLLSTRWLFPPSHRAAVLALAEALMIYRTLDASMIDTIIAAAPERAQGRLGRGNGERGRFCRRRD
jgi:hypothetical protein